MFSSNTFTSMKRKRSLGNIVVFMECEKSLKDTPLFSLFSCYHDEYEKMKKVYSVAFSCIFERDNEQRMSS
jgi:hypothetical protein